MNAEPILPRPTLLLFDSGQVSGLLGPGASIFFSGMLALLVDTANEGMLAGIIVMAVLDEGDVVVSE